MGEEIYRKQNVDRIKSPDNLNEYIKIATPGMWMSLVAILVFTVGVTFWCIFARLETRETSAVVVNGNVAKCYLNENMQRYVNDSMTIEIENVTYELGEHSTEMEKLNIDDENDEALLYLMEQNSTGWYYIYNVNTQNLKDGLYKGVIIVDSVKPISFIINRK